MSLTADARDIGQLLAYALRPKLRPGVEGDYGRLMSRYLDDATFRTAFDAVLDGMDLRVLYAGDLGLVLNPRRESVFAYRLSSEPATWNKESARVLRGLAHLGIAAYVYPHPDELHDPTVRYVDVVPCEAFIRRSCQTLRTRAEEVAQGGGDGAEQVVDRVVDLALAAGVDAAWSLWDQMPAIEVGSTGRGSGRISTKCSAYWVLRAMRDLVDHGLAKQVGKETDGRFQILERYRHQVTASAALEGYQALTAIARGDEDLDDPRDPDTLSPLPGRPPRWADQDPGTRPTTSRTETGQPETDQPETDQESA